MTARKQIEAFDVELNALITRTAQEYDLSYASVIGVLQLRIHTLCKDAEEEPNKDDEDGIG